MQPYFFPYLGYYSLIKCTDKFILFDTVQFIRHGWIERNRILKPGEGWQYIQVPLVKSARETRICDVRIRTSEPWKDKIIAQLQHYKKRAPFYADVIDLVWESINCDADDIVRINHNILVKTCDYLGIPFRCEIFSKMNIEIENVHAPDEWALNISRALRAGEYVNPPGGKDLFDRSKYTEAGVKLTLLGNTLQMYSQRRNGFESGLSIIDVLMFNDKATTNDLIDSIFHIDSNI